MQIPLQITVRNIEHTSTLDTEVREKVEKLQQFYSDIVSCHVVIELENKSQQHGNHYVVKIDLNVPGKEIVVNKNRAEKLSTAIKEAFDAARRQLEDHARR